MRVPGFFWRLSRSLPGRLAHSRQARGRRRPRGPGRAAFLEPLEDRRLTFLERFTDGSNGIDGLSGVSALAIDRNGEYLYATGSLEEKVAVFSIGSSGKLFFRQALLRVAAWHEREHQRPDPRFHSQRNGPGQHS